MLLVVGQHGAMLIDSGPAEAAPLVAADINRLGLRLTKVKLILSTHAHVDHAVGLAKLRRRTGATLAPRAAEQAALASGVIAADDPQRDRDKLSYPGVPIDRVLRTEQPHQLVWFKCQCIVADAATAAGRWSEAEPEGSNGGVAASGAGGQYARLLCGRTML